MIGINEKIEGQCLNRDRNRIRNRVLAVANEWWYAHNNALNLRPLGPSHRSAPLASRPRLMRALCAVSLEIVNQRISDQNLRFTESELFIAEQIILADNESQK